ncbi:MAG: hypothetical protein D6705_00515 [Deltaproteobacteria bacterium]|nr:MAG: hypothetical protein D6705_00515 [Deltaproteobacteria bacterium]
MRRSTIIAFLLACGCVFGARAERDVSGSFDLQDVDTVRVDVPDSPLTVVACTAEAETCPRTLSFEGTWLAFGGTRSEAEKTTERGDILFEVDEGFARLETVEDVDVEELLRLEFDELRLPNDVDLELVTDHGDIDVSGTRANVRALTGAGDVVVFGADAGVVVRTDYGAVDVHTPGIVDLATEEGDVHLAQTGGPRDAYVYTGRGELAVDLASDANLDLYIEARGPIDVKTDLVNTITEGAFHRVTGNGTVRVVLSNDAGPVIVRLFSDGA